MVEPRVVIIEDEFFVAQHLKQLVEQLGFEVVDVFHSGEDFLTKTDWEFDTALVDIFLAKELTGLDIAHELKENQKPFIFITANQDVRTLKEAARLGPSSYISKPFKANDVAAALEIVANKMPSMLTIRGVNGVEQISPNDITFIKSDGAYIEMHTTRSMVVQRKLLHEIMEELPETFLRVHRSYLVNTQFIDGKTAVHLIVRGTEIPISRNYKDELRRI
ncbi:MAG: response regulator transcription factor [Bacteroidetes bacterium]|nr:response regulator transcription factor [Bacteroidota bacterium]